MQGRGLSEWKLERQHRCAKHCSQLSEHAIEIGAFTILLVHEDHARHAPFGNLAPQQFGLQLDAINGTHHDHGKVGNIERGIDLVDEVGISGSVDQIDLVGQPVGGLPFERRHREREREPPTDLFWFIVEHTGAFIHTPTALNRSCLHQKSLCQRGLARPAMADQHNIADLVGWVTHHGDRPHISTERSLVGLVRAIRI